MRLQTGRQIPKSHCPADLRRLGISNCNHAVSAGGTAKNTVQEQNGQLRLCAKEFVFPD